MKFIGKLINVLKRAVGWNQLKAINQYLFRSGKALWDETQIRKKGGASIASLGYSKEHLQETMQNFKRILVIYLIVASLAFLFGLYKFTLHDGMSSLVAFSLSVLCLAQSFRYHFWMFQIRQGRLGCSIGEWLHAWLKGK